MAEEREETKAAKTAKGADKDLRGILRISETDIDGTKKLPVSLTKIKGIGQSLALAVTRAAGLDPSMKAGNLADEEVRKLEEIISDPLKFGIPAHMLNRRSDPFRGGDRHITASELAFIRKIDIDHMKKIRCYKGIRHESGLPVRGQRTRSSFRKGTRMGVVKKSVRGGKKPAPAKAAPKKEAKK